jgi:hypothetical protein
MSCKTKRVMTTSNHPHLEGTERKVPPITYVGRYLCMLISHNPCLLTRHKTLATTWLFSTIHTIPYHTSNYQHWNPKSLVKKYTTHSLFFFHFSFLKNVHIDVSFPAPEKSLVHVPYFPGVLYRKKGWWDPALWAWRIWGNSEMCE